MALFATALAIGTALLPGAERAVAPNTETLPPRPPARDRAASTFGAGQLVPLWTLLDHLDGGEVEGIRLAEGLLTLRLRSTDPFPLARKRLELQPAASAIVEPPLGEAAGIVELTLPIE